MTFATPRAAPLPAPGCLRQAREQVVKEEIAKLATKAELEIWGGALLARLTEFTERSEKRLLIDLARHLKASEEELSARLAVIDEKYADLPGACPPARDQGLRSQAASLVTRPGEQLAPPRCPRAPLSLKSADTG